MNNILTETLKTRLSETDLNFQINIVCIDLLVEIAFCSTMVTKKEIITLIRECIFLNKSFYKRRFYIEFIEFFLRKFTFKHFYELGLMEDLLYLLDDNSIILTSALELITKIYPFIDKIEELKVGVQEKIVKVGLKHVKNNEITKVS